MKPVTRPGKREGDQISPFRAFFVALQFLTIFPALLRGDFSAPLLGRSVGFYPLIGAVIGLLIWGASSLLALVFPVWLSAALVLVLWVGLTGMLHLDGFLDSCDGLLGGWTPEQRLEILRDERRGAFAVVGGVLLLLVKYAALVSLPADSSALVLAPVLGRWGMAAAIVGYPYARSQGLGRAIKDNAGWPQALLATLFSLGIAWLAGGLAGLVGLGLAAVVLWLIGRYALSRIPGMTGDLYGATNEVLEVVILVYANGMSLSALL